MLNIWHLHEKSRGLYQSMVTSSLTCIYGQVTKHITVKWPIGKKPEKIRALTGFEAVTSANTGAMLYQLSYEATHWERGQFIEFISPVRSDMM